jgi:hypothetical protein
MNILANMKIGQRLALSFGFLGLYAVLCGTARLHFAEAGVKG